ncbi:uncharacterized protein RJT20DRAFT_128839 [Scheffersomyces xylosifermentans]|uniref:uncharacterized protein n=1 Tax=Scheffersomyces xylosifermentans TaxID=1304137 RepID=UPI00315CCC12
MYSACSSALQNGSSFQFFCLEKFGFVTIVPFIMGISTLSIILSDPLCPFICTKASYMLPTYFLCCFFFHLPYTKFNNRRVLQHNGSLQLYSIW